VTTDTTPGAADAKLASTRVDAARRGSTLPSATSSPLEFRREPPGISWKPPILSARRVGHEPERCHS
jgi:hypothetical protein